MTMVELQNILSDRIISTLDPTLTPEQRKEENERSAMIASLSKQMINNANLILKAEAYSSMAATPSNSKAKKLITG